MVPSETRIKVTLHVSKLSEYYIINITLGYLSCVWQIKLIHYSRSQTEPLDSHALQMCYEITCMCIKKPCLSVYVCAMCMIA